MLSLCCHNHSHYEFLIWGLSSQRRETLLLLLRQHHLVPTSEHCVIKMWYSEKFLKGQWDKVECDAEWQKYRACLSQHLKDKHLSRFLEAEGIVDSTDQADSGRPVNGAAVGVSQ
ncbi:hypothetical protein L1049_017975 [Liquidambar formosana]|uniref:Uncharacterized protein n=1 Tax=Liquidambar formosana TaxID=63359 RepID=A0AAP0NHQ4_LIQFO